MNTHTPNVAAADVSNRETREMIASDKVEGTNVYRSNGDKVGHIERIMLDHPHIGGVSVIGIPDERLGEAGMAFVIAKPGVEPDAAEIVAWCRREMANYKVPKRVTFVDALPLNASGKVLKHELRARVRAGEV